MIRMELKKYLTYIGASLVFSTSIYFSYEKIAESYQVSDIIYKECRVIRQLPDGVIKQSHTIEQHNYIYPQETIEDKLYTSKEGETIL